MRLFTGIALPSDVIGNLTRLLQQLRPTAHLRWSPPYNLHITTRFIGEWPDERLDELKAAVAGLPRPGDFDIAIKGLRWVPNPHSPRYLWATVEAPPALSRLASATDEALIEVGIPKESRDFSPHLTLARMGEPVVITQLQQTIARLQSVDFGSFTADRFSLYHSEPGPAGSIYTQLAEYPLQ